MEEQPGEGETLRPGYKIWLEENGRVFGEGIGDLLEGVSRHGSLSRAAREMNMSYRQAWGLIRMVEDRLGYPLIHSQAGGGRGGGSHLTPEGETLLRKFRLFHKRAEAALNEIFGDIFGD